MCLADVHEHSELLTADIHRATATKYVEALNVFDQYMTWATPLLYNIEAVNLLLKGLCSIFGVASELACWDQVMQELSSQPFADLSCFPDSRQHLKTLWRLHNAFAVSTEFRTPVHCLLCALCCRARLFVRPRRFGTEFSVAVSLSASSGSSLRL